MDLPVNIVAGTWHTVMISTRGNFHSSTIKEGLLIENAGVIIFIG